MRVRSRQIAMGAALVLVTSGISVLTSPIASAEPCGGIAGPGSSPLFGSAGAGGGGLPARGPQGPLPAISGNTQAISWITGPVSQNSTFDRFGVSGTDLGISWDNGSGQTLMAFGDTFGDCSVTGGQWRSNVLLRTNDTNLADGITVKDAVPGDSTSGAVVQASAPRFASQVIPSLGIPKVENTTIPTAAISINGVQYMNYMSVREFGAPGRWVTNFSAIAVSKDNGQTWVTDTGTLRVNAGITIPGVPQADESNGKYQQEAYAMGNDGYLYQFGTPNGRFADAFVARVKPEDILDLTKYEYSTQDPAKPWSPNVADSVAIVKGPVSEMSATWNAYLNKYIMFYGNEGDGTLDARTADKPEGPWSAPKLLLTNAQTAGGVYAPFIYPNSTGKDMYFTASRWQDYNVMLLKTNLDTLR